MPFLRTVKLPLPADHVSVRKYQSGDVCAELRNGSSSVLPEKAIVTFVSDILTRSVSLLLMSRLL